MKMVLHITAVTVLQPLFYSKTQDIGPRLRPFKRGFLYLIKQIGTSHGHI